MRRLARILMLVGAALVSLGLVGRFALGDDGGEAGVGSPPPAVEPGEGTGVTDPAVSAPIPSEEPSPTPEPVPELAETPEEFFALWTEAVRSEDDAFLLARLHPSVLEIYGRPQCRAQIATLEAAPGFDVTVRRVRGPEPYEYAPDDQSVTVQDAFTLALTFSSSTGTDRQQGHLALVGDEMRWFTDCGDPLA